MPDYNNKEEFEDFQRMLGNFFGDKGVPKAAPKRDSTDPIDKLNCSLEDSGLGSMVSDTRYV